MQPLDGINCSGCVIDADVITYAGGAYNCEGCKLKGDRVALKGAALNTVIFLRQVTALLNTPEPPNTSTPIVKIAASKQNATLTFASAVQ
jgi:hypothetical protein